MSLELVGAALTKYSGTATAIPIIEDEIHPISGYHFGEKKLNA
jgi:hypothetical protein